MVKAEKTGYTLTAGAASEGVVINVAFAFPDVEAALAFEQSLEVPAGKAKKGKPEKAEKPAKGSKKAKDEDDEDEDEDEEDDEDEDSDSDEEDDEDEDEDEEDDEDEDSEDEEDTKKKSKGSKKDKDDSAGVTVKMTKELKAATKLRDVLEVLMGQGFKDPKKLTAICQKLQDKLPVLKNIKDLDTRVPRSAALLGKK